MPKRSWPGTIAHLVNRYTVVVNRGKEDGVSLDQRVLVYADSDETITDPETGEPLGTLEHSRGSGTVTHVQEKMATIRTDVTEEDTSFRALTNPLRRVPTPFKGAKVGDKVKPI